MSPDWLREVTSLTSKQAKDELLRMISEHIEICNSKINDTETVLDIDKMNERILMFVSKNKWILVWNFKCIDDFLSHLNTDPKDIRIETYWICRMILSRLLKDKDSWVKQATSMASNWVSWIFEQKESQGTLELEETDFRVDSANWEIIDSNVWKVKVHPLWDVWEYMEWDFKGSQKFTQESAIREATFQWKIIPNDNEWWEIMKSINPEIELNKLCQSDTSIRTKLWLELSGYRNANGDFFSQGEVGYYWSSSKNSGIRCAVTMVQFFNDSNPLCAFSVRCIKE